MLGSRKNGGPNPRSFRFLVRGALARARLPPPLDEILATCLYAKCPDQMRVKSRRVIRCRRWLACHCMHHTRNQNEATLNQIVIILFTNSKIYSRKADIHIHMKATLRTRASYILSFSRCACSEWRYTQLGTSSVTNLTNIVEQCTHHAGSQTGQCIYLPQDSYKLVISFVISSPCICH